MLLWTAFAVVGAASDALSQSRLGLSRVSAAQRSPVSELCKLRGGGSKCDVILVGCGVPKRGMGWYHAKQMLEGDVPSAELTAVVEPWFLGAGADSPPGETFGKWAKEMEAEHGTKFVKDVSELDIKVTHPCPLELIPQQRTCQRWRHTCARVLTWCFFLSTLTVSLASDAFVHSRRALASRSSPDARRTTRASSRRLSRPAARMSILKSPAPRRCPSWRR